MRILFIDLTTGLDSFLDLKTRGRGGMVSSLLLLPDALSKLNNECFVFSDSKSGGTTARGTTWLIDADWEWIAKQKWDFLILNRQTYGEGFPDLHSKHRVLWTHDMVHSGWAPNPERLKMLSATVFMSAYSEETWRAYYKDIGRSFQIPNGVDRELFKPGAKDWDSMIYLSAPNRGLAHLPVILDTVREATKREIKLTAFSNMATMHPKEPGEKFSGMYEEVKAAGVDLRDPVPQEVIAGHLARAGLMVKPSDFAETCSNTTLQSLSCGTPIITSAVGADKEWVLHRRNGMIQKHTLADGPLFILEFCRDVIEVLQNPRLHDCMVRSAPQSLGLFTWEEIGQKWNRMFNQIF